ncbi:MAG TPA: DUF5908 family protein [Mariniphaga sp.]|nr:DUF5908 family protein [Mariniphaga sp.]
MPIEIKELHIKAIVSDRGKSSELQSLNQEDIMKIKKEITKDVTERVIRILQQKNER